MVQRHRPDGEAVVDDLTATSLRDAPPELRAAGALLGAPAAVISTKGCAGCTDAQGSRASASSPRCSRWSVTALTPVALAAAARRRRRPAAPRRRRARPIVLGVIPDPNEPKRAKLDRRPGQRQLRAQRRRPRPGQVQVLRRRRGDGISTPASMIELSPATRRCRDCAERRSPWHFTFDVTLFDTRATTTFKVVLVTTTGKTVDARRGTFASDGRGQRRQPHQRRRS